MERQATPTGPPVAWSRHASELGTWLRVRQRPGPRLRGLVDAYHGYTQRLTDPAPHRTIPSATATLVLSLGPPQRIHAPHRRPPALFGSFVAGLHDRYVLIDAPAFEGIQVDLAPPAARALLGHPLRDLTGEIVPLGDLLGPDADRLVDDLAATPDWPGRFRRLDRFFSHRLLDGRRAGDEVVHAWRRLAASRGTVRVGELSTELGWSPRRLSGRFGAELGLPPKRMARLVRFGHAASLMASPDGPPLAEVATAAGYYDQAHLTNDVREICGLSPTRLLARRLPDDGGVFDRDGI